MNVGYDGNSKGLANFREDRQSLAKTDAARTPRGCAVRLVERRFIYQADFEPPSDPGKHLRCLHCVRATLHLARAGKYGQPLPIADTDRLSARRAEFDNRVGRHGNL